MCFCWDSCTRLFNRSAHSARPGPRATGSGQKAMALSMSDEEKNGKIKERSGRMGGREAKREGKR